MGLRRRTTRVTVIKYATCAQRIVLMIDIIHKGYGSKDERADITHITGFVF